MDIAARFIANMALSLRQGMLRGNTLTEAGRIAVVRYGKRHFHAGCRMTRPTRLRSLRAPRPVFR